MTPDVTTADKAYGSGPHLAWLEDQEIEGHVPVTLHPEHHPEGKLPRDAFTYDEASDAYTCPQGATLHAKEHRGNVRHLARRADCRDCPIKAACTDQPVRALNRSRHESARERAEERMGTPAFRISMRLRRRVERLFACGPGATTGRPACGSGACTAPPSSSCSPPPRATSGAWPEASRAPRRPPEVRPRRGTGAPARRPGATPPLPGRPDLTRSILVAPDPAAALPFPQIEGFFNSLRCLATGSAETWAASSRLYRAMTCTVHQSHHVGHPMLAMPILGTV